MNEPLLHVEPPETVMQPPRPPKRSLARILMGLGLLAVIAAAGIYVALSHWPQPQVVARPEVRDPRAFVPTAQQWAALGVETIQQRVFRSEVITEGKIAVNEDSSTPVLSPYAGRITKLLVRPGDEVKRGQPLFAIEATDAVQAQNELMAARASLNKARSQLELARKTETRLRGLAEIRAIATRELQQAQAEIINFENDVRSGEAAREAVRNRLRILGRTDPEIDQFEAGGQITAETTVFSPIAGTVVQRRVGPGQYISANSADPLFVIGDVSKLWLIAFVRESEATNVRVGQALYFKTLSTPGDVRGANTIYVAPSIDPTTRRLLVRATVANDDGKLKPEMFANVTILTGEGDASPAVPRDAVLYEGDNARLWIARPDGGVELRNIKPGLISDRYLQVLEGVTVGERVIVKGSVFIDREAGGG